MIGSPATDWVRTVAQSLGELRDQVVFLGGATVGLLITDQAAAVVRPTKDVDVIVEVGSKAEYDTRLRDGLIARGFAEDTEEGAPPCRWVVRGIKVDVMPTRLDVLGFTNRWYAAAMATARTFQLSDEINIRLVTAPYFVATKVEAFLSRGDGDFQASHDIEDVLALIDGRPEILDEAEAADEPVRSWLKEQMAVLLETPEFVEALPGCLHGDKVSQARLPTLVWRLHRMAASSDEQALLRALLDRELTGPGFPPVREVRLAHEKQRDLLDRLVEHGHLVLHRGRYSLSPSGLRACNSSSARREMERCNLVLGKAAGLYRSDPDKAWLVAHAVQPGMDPVSTARALARLSSSVMFAGMDWDDATGFVQSFRLGEPALDVEILPLE